MDGVEGQALIGKTSIEKEVGRDRPISVEGEVGIGSGQEAPLLLRENEQQEALVWDERREDYLDICSSPVRFDRRTSC